MCFYQYLLLLQFLETVGIFQVPTWTQFNLAKSTAALKFDYFEQFRIFEGLWEFYRMATQPRLPCAAFFKLSHISAATSKHTGQLPKNKGYIASNYFGSGSKMAPGQLPKSLGSCPCGYMGLFGQLPIYHAWYWRLLVTSQDHHVR